MGCRVARAAAMMPWWLALVIGFVGALVIWGAAWLCVCWQPWGALIVVALLIAGGVKLASS